MLVASWVFELSTGLHPGYKTLMRRMSSRMEGPRKRRGAALRVATPRVFTGRNFGGSSPPGSQRPGGRWIELSVSPDRHALWLTLAPPVRPGGKPPLPLPRFPRRPLLPGPGFHRDHQGSGASGSWLTASAVKVWGRPVAAPRGHAPDLPSHLTRQVAGCSPSDVIQKLGGIPSDFSILTASESDGARFLFAS